MSDSTKTPRVPASDSVHGNAPMAGTHPTTVQSSADAKRLHDAEAEVVTLRARLAAMEAELAAARA